MQSSQVNIKNQCDSETLGVLINNLGTPDSCEVKDVRKFLKQFLWDPRVIKMSRSVWWFVLNVIILNTRPKRSAEAYKKIWSPQGSPLLAISRQQANKTRKSLNATNPGILVELGMRYGNPSMEHGINSLIEAGASRILVLPLYPQFSYTTTASVEDEAKRICSKMNLTRFEVAASYFDHPGYIAALTSSVKACWTEHGKAEILLMSFHGIPQDYSNDGDPYRDECMHTAELLAESLNLASDEWQLSFQSRLGPKKWLEPYTDISLQQLAQNGVRSIQVICPGFSADCLETLEEIAMVNRDLFIEAGGNDYRYIPCLNDSKDHIEMLVNQILGQIK